MSKREPKHIGEVMSDIAERYNKLTKTKMSKKIIKDPFMGEIELTKLGETSKLMMGESRIDTIYTDDKENIWIDTWSTTGGNPIPMLFLRKGLVDLIIELKPKQR
jgi:hypothetical protein